MTVVGESDKPVRTAALIDRVADFWLAPKVPVMVEDVFDETAIVAIENVAVVAPETTVTEVGAVALVLLDCTVMLAPPEGAGPLRVTVPVDDVPPVTDVGERVRLVRLAGLIVRLEVFVTPPAVPVIVAETTVATADVVIENVELEAPAETVTVAGTVALELLDVRVTWVPPGPAGPFRVTVPLDELLPITVVGERVKPFNTAGLMVSIAVCVTPP
jgi:hypothetical protein